MIVFLATIALAAAGQDRPVTLSSALKEADTAYRSAVPFPIELPGGALRVAMDGYRDVLHRFGHIPRARAGPARCYFHLGNYAKAIEQFGFAGLGASAEAKEAGLRALLAKSLQRVTGKLRVLQLEPILGTARWVARPERARTIMATGSAAPALRAGY